MPTFKDANGREWTVKIDGPKAREVRKELNVDLVSLDGSAFEQLQDPILLVDCLYVLCRSQAQAANITDQQFGEALVGNAIEAATDALTAAIEDFFSEKKRELIKTLVKRNRATRELGYQEVMATMTDPEMETKIATAMKTEIRARLDNLLTRFPSASSGPAS